MARTWTGSNRLWQSLTPFQKAAAMALMEADGMRMDDARNVLGAIINRSNKTGEDLGAHVSRAIYQPTIEPAQEARLGRILKSEQFRELESWGQQRAAGEVADPVNGATHFLAPESVMLALERKNPSKYKNWGPRGANWTGYNPETGQYDGVITRDKSHAFLAPEGAYSHKPSAEQRQGSMNGGFGMSPQGAAGIAGAIQTAAPQAANPAFVDQRPPPESSPVARGNTIVADGAPSGGGLLSQLFGQGGANFASLMSGGGGSQSIPGMNAPAPQMAAAAPFSPQVDISSLVKILQNRSKLGTA